MFYSIVLASGHINMYFKTMRCKLKKGHKTRIQYAILCTHQNMHLEFFSHNCVPVEIHLVLTHLVLLQPQVCKIHIYILKVITFKFINAVNAH